ncbi:hypothetical protein LINPERPRIM_LOCUS23652 [Linum perenne]
MCFVDSRRRWLIPLSTTLRGGALEEWNRLMSRLDELPEDLITAGPVIPFWPLEASGSFSVRSLRGGHLEEWGAHEDTSILLDGETLEDRFS